MPAFNIKLMINPAVCFSLAGTWVWPNIKAKDAKYPLVKEKTMRTAIAVASLKPELQLLAHPIKSGMRPKRKIVAGCKRECV